MFRLKLQTIGIFFASYPLGFYLFSPWMPYQGFYSLILGSLFVSISLSQNMQQRLRNPWIITSSMFTIREAVQKFNCLQELEFNFNNAKLVIQIWRNTMGFSSTRWNPHASLHLTNNTSMSRFNLQKKVQHLGSINLPLCKNTSINRKMM